MSDIDYDPQTQGGPAFGMVLICCVQENTFEAQELSRYITWLVSGAIVHHVINGRDVLPTRLRPF